MTSPALKSTPPTYADLRRAVELAMVQGQRAADLARVRTYHETGRLIHTHLLLFQDRADYGARTIPRLAKDLAVDRSVLLRCVQFFRTFPIVASWRQLSWAHYRTLIPLEDPKLRRTLAIEANRHQWSVVQLEQRIRALLPPPTVDVNPPLPATPLVPKRGTPGICPIVAAGGTLVVDLGFASYLDLPDPAAFAAGDFVQFETNGRLTTAAGARKTDLFTYAAAVLKVVDGDTLWVKIYLRPQHWVKQKLRLRDLDCPEVDAPAGQAAKRYTSSLVALTTAVTVCTTKPDKYDRYLADVFLTLADRSEVFLNNALLEGGHAVRKEQWEFADWGA